MEESRAPVQSAGQESWLGEGQLVPSLPRGVTVSSLGQSSGQEARFSWVLVLSELLPTFPTVTFNSL